MQSAYDSLKNPDFRTEYDIYLRENAKTLPEELNFYKILGVLSDSSLATLTRAYQEVRGQIHPDRHEEKDSRLANERLKEVQTAHRTLLDPLLRARHDRILNRAGKILTHDAGEKPPRRKNSEQTPQSDNEFAKFDPPPAGPASLREEFSPADAAARTAEADAWYEQVFDLSVELEKAGGDEDLKEAAAWYRLLVQQRNHSEALQKLAPLLEQTGDIKEALYRYRQIEEMIPGKPARSAVLRQAWIYQTGFSKEGREIVPKDPEKAETLYRKAFRWGVSRREIAGRYDQAGDYEKAEEWLTGSAIESGLESFQPASSNNHEADLILPLHEGILTAAKQEPFSLQEETALKMIRILLKNNAGLNAVNHLGQTPLYLAAQNLYFNGIKILLRAGADPDIPDNNGDFPLHAALSAFAKSGKKEKNGALESHQGQEALWALSSATNAENRSGEERKTAFETAVDLKLHSIARDIGRERPPYDYLTNEERLRISQQAAASMQEEILQLVTSPPRFSYETDRTSPVEVKALQQIAALQNRKAPLTLEEEEMLVAQAADSARFSMQKAALEILRERPPRSAPAQERLLSYAYYSRLSGGITWQELQISELLYDIVSNLPRLFKSGLRNWPSPKIRLAFLFLRRL